MWCHKLEIDNASVNILRGRDYESGDYKELILAYKTCNINTYTVIVQNISGKDNEKKILF